MWTMWITKKPNIVFVQCARFTIIGFIMSPDLPAKYVTKVNFL